MAESGIEDWLLRFFGDMGSPGVLRLDLGQGETLAAFLLMVAVMKYKEPVKKNIERQGQSLRKLIKSFSSISDVKLHVRSTVPPQRRKERKTLLLRSLPIENIPRALKYDFYFLFEEREFAHSAIFGYSGIKDVVSVLDHIHSYAEGWLKLRVKECLAKGWSSSIIAEGPGVFGQVEVIQAPTDTVLFAPERIVADVDSSRTSASIALSSGVKVYGGVFDTRNGSIYIGPNTVVEPGATIAGPAIIGSDCVMRAGAYIRGDAVIGDGVYIRCECKNVLIMDKAEFCHPGYLGDSICGYRSHFGNQATAANLPLLPSGTIRITLDDVDYDTSRRKLGIILGDYAQLGCSSVSDPGTLVGPRTHIYPLTRLNKGVYGPNELIKNKPLEHGVIERAPLLESSS